jgi:FSR family fosmidomycin resistance protein-like MFS transporter
VWPLAVVLAASFFATLPLTRRHVTATGVVGGNCRPTSTKAGQLLWLTLSLLLVSVAVRSLVGFSAARGLSPSPWLFFGIPIGAFVGKSLGGFVADRLGWIETSALALIASAPCIAMGQQHTAVLLLGLCLFQMTMPVTLAAVARLMPDRLSTAFGWTCLALILGALPPWFVATQPVCVRPALPIWITLACVAVTLGLRQLGIQLRGHHSRARE